jgi:hypothetical protein
VVFPRRFGRFWGVGVDLVFDDASEHQALPPCALGPYDRYAENREAHNNVMRVHRDASYPVLDSAVGDTHRSERAF